MPPQQEPKDSQSLDQIGEDLGGLNRLDALTSFFQPKLAVEQPQNRHSQPRPQAPPDQPPSSADQPSTQFDWSQTPQSSPNRPPHNCPSKSLRQAQQEQLRHPQTPLNQPPQSPTSKAMSQLPSIGDDDVEVIAIALNQTLNRKGITAVVGAKNGTLQVRVIADDVPEQSSTTTVVRKLLLTMGYGSFGICAVAGRSRLQPLPGWGQEIILGKESPIVMSQANPSISSRPRLSKIEKFGVLFCFVVFVLPVVIQAISEEISPVFLTAEEIKAKCATAKAIYDSASSRATENQLSLTQDFEATHSPIVTRENMSSLYNYAEKIAEERKELGVDEKRSDYTWWCESVKPGTKVQIKGGNYEIIAK